MAQKFWGDTHGFRLLDLTGDDYWGPVEGGKITGGTLWGWEGGAGFFDYLQSKTPAGIIYSMLYYNGFEIEETDLSLKLVRTYPEGSSTVVVLVEGETSLLAAHSPHGDKFAENLNSLVIDGALQELRRVRIVVGETTLAEIERNAEGFFAVSRTPMEEVTALLEQLFPGSTKENYEIINVGSSLMVGIDRPFSDHLMKQIVDGLCLIGKQRLEEHSGIIILFNDNKSIRMTWKQDKTGDFSVTWKEIEPQSPQKRSGGGKGLAGLLLVSGLLNYGRPSHADEGIISLDEQVAVVQTVEPTPSPAYSHAPSLGRTHVAHLHQGPGAGINLLSRVVR